MSVSPHVMSQADAALGRVIAETSTTPSASQYWQQKRPLFRQLAIRVVQAMQEGLGKDQAVARSITELHSEVLQRAATDSARQEYSEWFERRAGFLSGVAKRLWERTTQITASPQESIQPEGNVVRDTPPSNGIYVALEAHPNDDFSPGDWRGGLLRPLEWKRVSGLSEAVEAVDQFIRTHDLGGGNFVGLAGQVAKDGQPWARISYNRRIWQGWDREGRQELDRNGNPIASVEVGTTGNVAVPDIVRSYKAEMKAHGGWTANQRRYATPEEADAAGRDLYSRWTAAEDYRVVPSSDPPNVEPVINVKPAEETARSDSRIIVMHVADEPKPAQRGAAVTAPAFPTEPIPQPWGVWRDIGKPEERLLKTFGTMQEAQSWARITWPSDYLRGVVEEGVRCPLHPDKESEACNSPHDDKKARKAYWNMVFYAEPEAPRTAAPAPSAKPMSPPTEEAVLRYSLTIEGKWGRKRTNDFLSVDLAKRIDPKKPLPLDTLLIMMRNKIAELKVQPGAVVKLVEQPWTVSSTGIERTALLSGRTLHTEMVK